MKINPKTVRALRKHLRIIEKHIRPHAELMAKAQDRPAYNCVLTIMRPYLREFMDEKYKASLIDMRAKEWEVTLTFWEVTGGLDGGELVAECEPEIVRGFDDVIELILLQAEDLHSDNGVDIRKIPIFSYENMRKRFHGMRPAISRGGGSAGTQIQYVVNDFYYYMIQVQVSRVENSLTR